MKLLMGIILAFVLATMSIGLFSVSTSMHMSHGADMSDCPFMTHGEVVCAMSVTDHLNAWKATFLGTMPTMVIVLSVVLVAFLLMRAPHLLIPLWRSVYIPDRQLRERTYSFLRRPLQELFSNGILHTKVFL